MKKITREQMEKIKADILKETFPNGNENEQSFLYPIAEVVLLMLSKFIEKYQEAVQWNNSHMSNIEDKKETAIQDEQQLNPKLKIINDIIKVLDDNNLSISESREILNNASKKLGQQTVRVSY